MARCLNKSAARHTVVQAPPLRVLAEVKDALSARYFDDKRWSLESLNEQKARPRSSAAFMRAL